MIKRNSLRVSNALIILMLLAPTLLAAEFISEPNTIEVQDELIVKFDAFFEDVSVSWNNLPADFNERTGEGVYEVEVCEENEGNTSCAQLQTRLRVTDVPLLKIIMPGEVVEESLVVPLNFKWGEVHVYPRKGVKILQAHCEPRWECSDWSPGWCNNRSIELLNRTCIDRASCLTEFEKPVEQRECEYAPLPVVEKLILPPPPPPEPKEPPYATIISLLLVILCIPIGLVLFFFSRRKKNPKKKMTTRGKPLDVTMKDFILFYLKSGYHPSQVKTMLMSKGYNTDDFESFIADNLQQYVKEHPELQRELHN